MTLEDINRLNKLIDKLENKTLSVEEEKELEKILDRFDRDEKQKWSSGNLSVLLGEDVSTHSDSAW